jgi:hypothetical protein
MWPVTALGWQVAQLLSPVAIAPMTMEFDEAWHFSHVSDV